MSTGMVLVSWVSFGNDPFERDQEGEYKPELIPGPTLELLTHPHSPYRGKISRAFFFFRESLDPSERPRRKLHARDREVFEALRRELASRLPDLVVEACPWETEEAPTSHEAVFRFIVAQLRRIRERCGKAPLVVNLSPGTPQMHTTMLLALQAGYAGQPVEAVQGFRGRERKSPERILEPVPWDLLGRLNRLESSTLERGARLEEWSLENARSPRLRELMEEIRQVGRLPFPVLILGNRGTGKRKVAELLRAEWLTANVRGGVSDKGWHFRINCAALSGEVLRVELFGSVRGSFTGAGDKEGLLSLASGDCVLLDEFHHLEREVQAELLLPLESRGEFRPVGGKAPISSNFRLLAASNWSQEALREKLLPDLYDRISDFIIKVPDLSPHCRDDLRGIWGSVVRDTCRAVAHHVAHAKDAAAREHSMVRVFQEHEGLVLGVLGALRLPGNWRDLQRLARRLVARGLGPNQRFELRREVVQRELDDLARDDTRAASVGGGERQAFQLPDAEACRDAAARALEADEKLPVKQLLAELETRLFEAAMEVTRSDRQAAALVGLSPSTFRERKNALEQPSGPKPTG